MEQKKNRILYFDGLRGLMAIIVAYGHFFGETKLFMLSHYPEAFPYWLSKFYKLTETTPFVFTINGNFATIVFFILSGAILLGAFKANTTFIASLIRRFIRLGLPVFASCIIGYILVKSGLRYDHDKNVAFDEVIKQGILTLYTTDFSTRFLNPVIWSMSTEFMGSLLLLIVAQTGKNNSNRGILLLFLFTIFSYGYYVFFLLIGAWISILFADEKTNNLFNREKYIITLLIVLAIVILQSCPTFHPWGWIFIPGNYFVSPLINLQDLSLPGMFPYHPYEFLRGIGAILLLILVMSRGYIRDFLSTKFVQFFGKISFSLYLIHWLVLSSAIMPLNLYIYTHTNSVYLAYIVSFLMFATLSLVGSMIFYTLIEKNSVILSRAVGKTLDKIISNAKI
ncbi:TPA: acyltransferase family protein [Escherichia coli]|uniref:acyltransferase family protein n=1 Tax=Escherichia coli TaxID=562 RepID=UPI0015E86969|nr:acyltransferase [Escherichia coli]HAI0063238.1 acyltransferase [Escherichia coli]HAM3595603.1 acyltransferase [Escherichia coli]